MLEAHEFSPAGRVPYARQPVEACRGQLLPIRAVRNGLHPSGVRHAHDRFCEQRQVGSERALCLW
jgi:hypothetical protein